MDSLSTILGKIYPNLHQNGRAAAPSQQRAPIPGSFGGPPQGSSRTGGPEPPPEASASQPIDLETILDDKAAHAGQPPSWRTSLVDLLLLLELDHSLPARQQLARDLNYPGDMDDDTAMDNWVHRQLMNALAEQAARKVPGQPGDQADAPVGLPHEKQ